METVICYALTVYFWFHFLSRSDLCENFRNRLIKILGPTLSYPLFCAFCFSFHTAWILLFLTNFIPFWFTISPMSMLFVAPVINLFIDLAIRKLRMDAEPPVLVSNGPTQLHPDFRNPPAIDGWKS